MTTCPRKPPCLPKTCVRCFFIAPKFMSLCPNSVDSGGSSPPLRCEPESRAAVSSSTRCVSTSFALGKCSLSERKRRARQSNRLGAVRGKTWQQLRPGPHMETLEPGRQVAGGISESPIRSKHDTFMGGRRAYMFFSLF